MQDRSPIQTSQKEWLRNWVWASCIQYNPTKELLAIMQQEGHQGNKLMRNAIDQMVIKVWNSIQWHHCINLVSSILNIQQRLKVLFLSLSNFCLLFRSHLSLALLLRKIQKYFHLIPLAHNSWLWCFTRESLTRIITRESCTSSFCMLNACWAG